MTPKEIKKRRNKILKINMDFQKERREIFYKALLDSYTCSPSMSIVALESRIIELEKKFLNEVRKLSTKNRFGNDIVLLKQIELLMGEGK